ncbi:M23 family metallopeptidase [Streptomyces sp. CRN 30]|uniref:M23 family metallopeptidase n=1 Tax=Streptomyces sp. CRN 30 TaxID=3075613 RepID=UPI002A838F42|nr:M23 family metallopeptidase [Streptomyces sp. CRN 30]
MNDRHPSGTTTTPAAASEAASAHYAPYGTQEAQYGDLTTYNGYDTTGFPTADPLYGNLPGQHTGSYDTAAAAYDTATGSYDMAGTYDPTDAYGTTGTYDTTQWTGGHASPDTGSHQIVDTGAHQALHYDVYAAQHHAAYDTGAYATAAWADVQQPLSAVPSQTGEPDASGQWDSGQWDSAAWLQPETTAGDPDGRSQQWAWGTQPFDTGGLDTGAFDATQWNVDGTPADDTTPQHEHARPDDQQHPLDRQDPLDPQDLLGPHDPLDPRGRLDDGLAATGELPVVAPLLEEQEEITPAADVAPHGSRAAARGASRSRRRQPAKRSALLTIAVPSACVMGVAGIAAASVDGLGGEDAKETATTASDTQAVKPSAANSRLDTQLASLSAGADDFADRASRTQERIDLKAEQALEKKRAAEEAARQERLRPKFALPVAQHGLSAYYGQGGINWMSVHSGIDFPVSYGTTVMAATDGTVRTQFNSSYGNMMIVTAKDGTETWYCHLSSYQVPSGTTVKAGDAIAYSGNTGNSTGPHLHFEVRPAGGSAIDPLAWLRSHDLDPT